MIYSKEVEEMCPVAKGVDHGPAPIPEEGKWVKSKEIKDISGLTIKIPPTNKNTIVSIIPEFKYLFNLFNIFYLFLFYLNKFLILVHRFVLDDSSVMFVFSSCFSLPSNTIINLVSSFMLVLFDAYDV